MSQRMKRIFAFFLALSLSLSLNAGFVSASTAKNKILADDGANSDYFGWSVAIDGDTAVVGAFNDDDNGNASGSAYVFMRSGSGWIQQTKLIANDGASGDYFGHSVAINGDTIVVGAYFDNDNGSASGSAYVFIRSESGWVQQAKLIADDGALGDYFGRSVAIDGDTAVVGAFADDDNGNASGSAYIFIRSESSWNQQAKLIAGDGEYGDLFGWSVAISNDTIVVGAHYDDVNGIIAAGSAYVFARSENGWIQQAKLTIDDSTIGDFFGWSVAISGDTILVGAHYDDDNGDASGSTYVFMRRASIWIQQTKLIASDGEEVDWFGFSVAIDGDIALVGAPYDDDNGYYSGSAYTYQILYLDMTIAILRNYIDTLDLPKGTKNSLNTSLDTAAKILEDSNSENDVAAINTLQAFINQVKAQRGKKIPGEVADVLFTNAQELIVALSGEY